MTDDLRAVKARAAEIAALRTAQDACRHILVKLQLIDDAPTSHVRTFGQTIHRTDSDGLRTRDKHGLGVKSGQFSTSQIPEGVRLGGDLTKRSGHGEAPSKAFSLWGHYHWRMIRAQAAKDAPTLLKLAACATRDYEIHIGKRTTNHPNHEAAVTELLRDCTGMTAVEASWWLDTSVAWIKRQRVLSGRDAEMGESSGHDKRMQRILALKASGATTKTIAAEVGISTGQVSNLLNGRTSSHDHTRTPR